MGAMRPFPFVQAEPDMEEIFRKYGYVGGPFVFWWRKGSRKLKNALQAAFGPWEEPAEVETPAPPPAPTPQRRAAAAAAPTPAPPPTPWASFPPGAFAKLSGQRADQSGEGRFGVLMRLLEDQLLDRTTPPAMPPGVPPSMQMPPELGGLIQPTRPEPPAPVKRRFGDQLHEILSSFQLEAYPAPGITVSYGPSMARRTQQLELLEKMLGLGRTQAETERMLGEAGKARQETALMGPRMESELLGRILPPTITGEYGLRRQSLSDEAAMTRLLQELGVRQQEGEQERRAREALELLRLYSPRVLRPEEEMVSLDPETGMARRLYRAAPGISQAGDSEQIPPTLRYLFDLLRPTAQSGVPVAPHHGIEVLRAIANDPNAGAYRDIAKIMLDMMAGSRLPVGRAE